MKDATILTIAHRIRTIIDYDAILVLSSGSIVEFDSPAALLSRDSEFASLCKKSGEYEELVELSRLANL